MTNEREEEIRRRAYEIWEAEGRPEGLGEEHWRRARAEIEGRAGGGAGEAGTPAQSGPQGDPAAASTGTSEGTKPDGAPPSPAQAVPPASPEGGSATPEGGSSPDPRNPASESSRGGDAISEGTKPDGAPPA